MRRGVVPHLPPPPSPAGIRNSGECVTPLLSLVRVHCLSGRGFHRLWVWMPWLIMPVLVTGSGNVLLPDGHISFDLFQDVATPVKSLFPVGSTCNNDEDGLLFL